MEGTPKGEKRQLWGRTVPRSQEVLSWLRARLLRVVVAERMQLVGWATKPSAKLANQ